MNIQKVLLSFTLFTLIHFELSAQVTDAVKFDSLYKEIELLIGDSWYLEETEKGFQVVYCRSCNEKYNVYLDSADLFNSNKERGDFFLPSLLDSVSYYSTVSISPIPPSWSKKQRIEYYTGLFKPEDILSFNVILEEKWSQQKFDSILAKNELLKNAILTEPLYKSNENIFSDYRFSLPEDYWRKRTTEFDFYFERLPYSSVTLDYSILIEQDKPTFFCEPMLVDKNDLEFFYKNENHLETERIRALKIIALVLGIHDYKIIN